MTLAVAIIRDLREPLQGSILFLPRQPRALPWAAISERFQRLIGPT